MKSADSFMAIVKEEDGRFTGYHCLASLWFPTLISYRIKGVECFWGKTREEAAKLCQSDWPSEDYRFVNLK